MKSKKIIIVDFDYPSDSELVDVNIPNDVQVVEKIVPFYSYVGSIEAPYKTHLIMSIAFPDWKNPTIENIAIPLSNSVSLQKNQIDVNIPITHYNAKMRFVVRKLESNPAGTNYPKFRCYLICKTR